MKYNKIGVTLGMLAVATLFFSSRPLRKYMKQAEFGTVIFLNGPSSSGKSSIAKHLQERLDVPYLHTGIDKFLSMLPPAYCFGKQGAEGFAWSPVKIGDLETVEVAIGPWGKKLSAGMYAAIAALAKAGNNIIVDDVMLTAENFSLAKKALKGLKVYFVGVLAGDQELAKRERARGNRPLGSAVVQNMVTHTFGSYDLEIDSGKMMPEKGAAAIIAFIKENPSPHGLR